MTDDPIRFHIHVPYYDMTQLMQAIKNEVAQMKESGHTDHQHVGTYDQGGYLKPGLNLAYRPRRWHKRLLLWLYRNLPG